MKGFIVVAAILAVIAITSAVLISTGDAPTSVLVAESFMQDVELVNKRAGRSIWTLTASKIDLPDDGKTALLSQVDINLIEHKMKVISPSGLYNLKSRDLLLQGGVTARGEDYTLKTASIKLDNRTGDLSTDEDVVIVGQKYVIRGRGLRADNQNRIRLNSDVNATFN